MITRPDNKSAMFSYSRTNAAVLCLVVLLLISPATSLSQSATDRTLYMIGYSYGMLMLNLTYSEQYLDNDIMLLKMVLGINVAANDLSTRLSSTAVSSNFLPSDVAQMNLSLRKLFSGPMPLAEMKQEFESFDRRFLPYLDRSDRVSFWVTLGSYTAMLTHFQPIIVPKVTVSVWDGYILPKAAGNDVTDDITQLISNLVIPLKKLDNQKLSAQTQDTLRTEVRELAGQIHTLLQTK